MAEQPIPGMLAAIESKERVDQPTCLQVGNLRKEGTKFRCTWMDGSRSMPGYMGPDLTKPMEGGLVESGGIARLIEYSCNQNPTTGEHVLAAFKLEVVSKTDPALATVKSEPLAVKLEGGADNAGPVEPVSAAATATATPRSAKENQGPFKTPAAKMLEKHAGTPGFTPPSTGRKAAQPIQALNPYNNNWTLRARVASKGPLRSMSRNGQAFSLFSVTLVDEEGSEIEGTFWRDLADQWYERIGEGKVYYLTKGRVKPANRAFTAARNDYTIDFQADSLIEECADMVDPSKMQARLCYTRLDALHGLLGRKMLADVLAVVKETAPLSSVKRRSDGADLPRRDLTLVDQSGKMARLTVWGSTAEGAGAQLEGLACPVVSIAGVRVGDYDGLSLSTVSRSVLTIEPDTPEAAELRRWWAAGGSSQQFAHAGEGLANGRRSGDRANARGWLADISREELAAAPPSAKPEFVNVHATVMRVDPDQTPFFYPADAATGKKVLQDGGGAWRLAADDSPCAAMEWRYFVRVTLADATADATVMLNNDQAERLLGRKADEMHELKEAGSPEFQAIIAAAQFSEWTLTIKSKTSEFKGEVRQQLQGFGRQLTRDYAAECRWLLSRLQAPKA